jgi:hypothetical protein
MYLTIKFLFLFVSYVDSCNWSPTQCGCSHTQPSIYNRIVGGTAATPHSWPVSLQKKIHIYISSSCYFSGWSLFFHLVLYVVKSECSVV